MNDTAMDDLLRARVKVELRKRMRGVRKSTPLSVIESKSTTIIKTLTEMPEVQEARGVAIFWPITERHEIDLRPFDAWLREQGKKVAYPSIDPETRVMGFRTVSDLAMLEERGLGFAEPPYDAEPATLDTIIVPALAIDPTGARLGYGAGFYDRALRAMRNAFPHVRTIGVAFEFQYVSELPVLPHDERVDWVVTESRRDRAVSSPSVP